MLEHQDKKQATTHFISEFKKKTEKCDGFLGFVVVRNQDKLELCVRTTHNFMRNDFVAVIALLAENLQSELVETRGIGMGVPGGETPQPPKPLPRVDREELLKSIFPTQRLQENEAPGFNKKPFDIHEGPTRLPQQIDNPFNQQEDNTPKQEDKPGEVQ
jgi:hypothetical protein